MMTDDIAASTATLKKMAKKLRNVCVEATDRRRSKKGQLLGRGREFVVIDESHFRHKRKVSANTIQIHFLLEFLAQTQSHSAPLFFLRKTLHIMPSK